jgi:hypothetical protein
MQAYEGIVESHKGLESIRRRRIRSKIRIHSGKIELSSKKRKSSSLERAGDNKTRGMLPPIDRMNFTSSLEGRVFVPGYIVLPPVVER